MIEETPAAEGESRLEATEAPEALDPTAGRPGRPVGVGLASFETERTIGCGTGDEAGRQVGAGEISDRVNEALVVLSPSLRAVFVMRHYEGLALAEIAEALECTVGSVKVHLFRALRKLQEELKDLKEA